MCRLFWNLGASSSWNPQGLSRPVMVLFYQIKHQWNIFTQIRAVWSVEWIFNIGSPLWRWLGEYVTLGKTFYSLLLKQEAVAAPSYCQIFLFLAFLEEAFIINIIIILCTNCISGTRSRSWLRHCATSRKVAGSIPDGVIGIFHWHPSGRTMALGSSQPLTEMSTRNVSWG